MFVLVVFAEHGPGDYQLRFNLTGVHDVMVTEALGSDMLDLAGRALELVAVRMPALPFCAVAFAFVTRFHWFGLLVQLDQLIHVEVAGDVI